MPQSIVVTGATSMIGTAIIREYLTHGVKKIYAIVRENCCRLDRLPNDKRVVVQMCNISDYASLKANISDDCDVFFHLAWQGTGKDRKKSTVSQARNIIYTLDALSIAKELGCRAFVGSGSQAEYGILDIPAIDENSPTQPIEPYGVAKYAAGRLALEEARRNALDCFWVRVFSVYGPNDKSSSMISASLGKMIAGERASFTPALQTWDYLYCDDAARAFRLLAEKASGQQVYCLGSGEPRQLKDYIYAMRDIANPEVEIGIGDIPYKGNEVMRLCADVAKLKRDTGWEPRISFEDGIRLLVDAMNKKVSAS